MGQACLANTHVQQPARAKASEQPGYFVGSSNCYIVQQDRFHNLAVERLQSPPLRRDAATNNLVPYGPDRQGALIEPMKVATSVLPPQDDESDQQENTQNGRENGLHEQRGDGPEMCEQLKSEIHSSTQSCFASDS